MDQMLQYHWKLWGQCRASKRVAEIPIRHTEIVEVVFIVSFSLTGDVTERNSPSSCREGFNGLTAVCSAASDLTSFLTDALLT